MIAITVLYSLIGLRLKRSHSHRDNQHRQNFMRHVPTIEKIHRKNHQSTKRVIKMLVAVVVAFFVCWAPFHAQRLVAIYGTREDHLAKSPTLLCVYSTLTYISGIFYYMSTCINPFFYHIMSNKFRDAFKNSVTKWCCRIKDTPGNKRDFYTAMPFSQRTTSNGTKNSDKSLGNRSSNKTKCFEMSDKQTNTGEKQYCQVCDNCKKRLDTPFQEFELKNIGKQSTQLDTHNLEE
ncbi:unnamed protein product [Parnassius apollo]|uniref:(apollo) hypothetical protein n=1 Tax=Parnassius apollo TaxID=110799 RepID=A0A8S3WQ31_PARAO|nr:unnamed protein product [Parnassius apollo]